MTPATTTTAKPAPPEDLDGEARLEWERVCDELAAAGRLDRADRAALTLYVRTWAVWKLAAKHVETFGAVLPMHNNVVGRSPFYAVMRETAAQLRNLLADLMLTPASRPAGDGPDDDDDAL
ncbi:MAG: hypothetical protein JWO31_3851 [Phycisphaerales bacterium]|nr:hypothetical protein [Phycisphaerales bacterium]